jgi:predicted nucleic acid-binding protein
MALTSCLTRSRPCATRKAEPDRALRSLDAIHLATARILGPDLDGPDLDGLVSYDTRLTNAAHDARLVALSPQD